MEYGVGIHGEPGIGREKIATADELAERMTDALLKELNIEKYFKGEVAVLVNGFGSTPLQELYLFNNAILKVLTEKNVKASRVFVGNYMTSIDMEGASISILKLDDELKKYLTAPSNAPAFKVSGEEEDIVYEVLEEVNDDEALVSYVTETSASYAEIQNEKISLNNMIYLVDRMSEVIIENEVFFCELDSHAGDGDFGMSVAKGFKQLKREWKDILANDSTTIGQFLERCSLVIMEYCGGASGPIWGSAFRAAGKYAGSKGELTAAEFAEMMQAAVKGIQDIGERSFGRGAVVGDKTLIDALVPYADTWSKEAGKKTLKEIFVTAADAAVAGAKETEKIVARMGRAGTVGERSIGYPDAGAYGLGVIFTELSESVR